MTDNREFRVRIAVAAMMALTVLATAPAAFANPGYDPPELTITLPALTITPSSGPRGTHFDIAGDGLQPGAWYHLIVRGPDGSILWGEDPPRTFLGPPAGPYLIDQWTAEPGEPLGTYTVELVAGTGPGAAVASASFTVTVAAPAATSPAASTAAPVAPTATTSPGQLPGTGRAAVLPPALLVVAAGGLVVAGWGLRRPG